MVGTARKNENWVAAARSTPSINPPMIVAPARETPGIIARIWQQPIQSAVRIRISSTFSTRGGGRARSITRIRIPPMIKLTATTQGENPANEQRDANHPGRKRLLFDQPVSQCPYPCRRQKGDHHVGDETLRDRV